MSVLEIEKEAEQLSHEEKKQLAVWLLERLEMEEDIHLANTALSDGRFSPIDEAESRIRAAWKTT